MCVKLGASRHAIGEQSLYAAIGPARRRWPGSSSVQSPTASFVAYDSVMQLQSAFCRRSRLAPSRRSRARRRVAQDTAPHSTGEAWQIVPLPQSSLVFARDGSLIGEIGREIAHERLDQVAAGYVAQAFIAVEDQRFYQHDGVDVIGVAGAIKGKILGEQPRRRRARSRSSSSGTCIPTSSTGAT